MEKKSWLLQEIEYIDKLPVGSHTKYALRANAAFEAARREGLDYEAIKAELIRTPPQSKL